MSRVLRDHGEKRDMICGSCANGMWQRIKEVPKKGSQKAKPAEEKWKYSCWCMLSHAYIITEFDDCDGFLPEEEPKL